MRVRRIQPSCLHQLLMVGSGPGLITSVCVSVCVKAAAAWLQEANLCFLFSFFFFYSYVLNLTFKCDVGHLFFLADYQKKFGEDYGSCQAGISNFLTEVSRADLFSQQLNEIVNLTFLNCVFYKNGTDFIPKRMKIYQKQNFIG